MFLFLLLNLIPLATSSLFSQHQTIPNLNNADYHDEIHLLTQQQQFNNLNTYNTQMNLLQSNNEQSHRSLQNSKPYYTTRLIDRKLEHISPADVHIKIFNYDPNKWYSVTITSHNEYTGSASFLRVVQDRPGNPLLYSWIPKFSGDYEVIVHELGERDAFTPPLEGEGGRFTVSNKEGFDSRKWIVDEIGRMPSCQSEDAGNKHLLFSTWEGSWIGPNMHGNTPGMRNGWYFLPSRDVFCKIEYFTDKELRANPVEASIYILGSSKERGIFLSLVDMLLDGKEKEQMHKSVISKCWGRAFVLKNNLKVFYQDWRSVYFRHLDASTDRDYLCHDDKVVMEGGGTYTTNALKVWEEIFKDQSNWPSVILMSTGEEHLADHYDLQHFVKSLPPSWKGTMLFTDEMFSAMWAGKGDEHSYTEYRNKIKELVGGFGDKRVKWLDGKGLSKDQRMYAEGGPNHVTSSQHFHSQCNERYRDENGVEQSMRICSNVTEMLGQLLIGHALGPKEQYIERISDSLYNGNKEVMYCHACPENLFPIHITPYPDMTCASGALHMMNRNEIHVGEAPELCPEKCLAEIPPGKEIQTQSGVVYERKCPMEMFEQSRAESDAEKMDHISKEIDQIEEQIRAVATPPDQENQDISVVAAEQRNQALPETTDEARRAPEVSNAILPIDEVDSTSSSLYSLWVVTLFLVGLTFCYQSKIKSMIRDAMHNTDNPYTSEIRQSLNIKLRDTKTQKLILFGAGFFGMLVLLLPNSTQSLRRASVVSEALQPANAARVKVATETRRPVMSTFFEPVEGGCCGMSEKGHLNLVEAWKAAWQSKGWDTKVYTAADAMKHPRFESVKQKLLDIGINPYDQRCVWRWLAIAQDNDPFGGWMSDYDTFPLSLTAEKGLELMKKPGFKSWTRHVPSLLHGDRESWNRMVGYMEDNIRADLHPTYKLSDMVIVMHLRDNYNLEDIGITVWEGAVFPGFPYIPNGSNPTIDCDQATQYLAAHISHASAGTDYNDKHTFPKIEGLGMVTLPAGVYYFAEYRAEAGIIMMLDYDRNCMENN